MDPFVPPGTSIKSVSVDGRYPAPTRDRNTQGLKKEKIKFRDGFSDDFVCKRENCTGTLTPIGNTKTHFEPLSKAKRRAELARQHGIPLTHGCCLTCDTCGDRPLSKAKKNDAKNGGRGTKRMAWQRYCALCKHVYTMNGFFAKHGTVRQAEERPLEQRAKKHKIELIRLAEKNIALHSHEVDMISMLDMEMRWLKLVKRFPHKIHTKTMTSKNIASIPPRISDGDVPKIPDIHLMALPSSSVTVDPSESSATLLYPGIRGDIVRDATSDSVEVSRLDSLDRVYSLADNARVIAGVVRNNEAVKANWDSDVVRMIAVDPSQSPRTRVAVKNYGEDVEVALPSPTRLVPVTRKAGKSALSKPLDNEIEVLDEAMRQLSNMSVAEDGENTEYVNFNRTDTNMSIASVGMLASDDPSIRMRSSDMPMGETGALDFSSLMGDSKEFPGI